MNKSQYRWETDSGTDYEDLLRPDGTIVTTITEPEDRCGYRDLAPIAVELNRLRAAVSWQPIETAPKDGTHVLVACPQRGVLRGRWEEDRFAKRPRPYWTNDASWTFGVLATRDDQPTHWMPLPPPPADR